MQDISQIINSSKSDIGVLLGSGSTINDITSEAWKRIQKYDLWSMNNWVFHPDIVPDFYHVEVKHYSFAPLRRSFISKQVQYRNTKFIFPVDKWVTPVGGRRQPTSNVLDPKTFPCIYTYRWENRSWSKGDPVNATYKIREDLVYRHYGTSLPSILELMYKFGYKHIYLYGIEFKNSFYFYTGGDPKYGEVYHQTNKEHEGKDPNRPHATFRIKDFIVDFNKQHMLPNGREIFIGTKKTELYPELKFKEV